MRIGAYVTKRLVMALCIGAQSVKPHFICSSVLCRQAVVVKSWRQKVKCYTSAGAQMSKIVPGSGGEALSSTCWPLVRIAQLAEMLIEDRPPCLQTPRNRPLSRRVAIIGGGHLSARGRGGLCEVAERCASPSRSRKILAISKPEIKRASNELSPGSISRGRGTGGMAYEACTITRGPASANLWHVSCRQAEAMPDVAPFNGASATPISGQLVAKAVLA